MYWHIFSKRKRRWFNYEAAELAAASKRFGYARGEKVMKEIRGGLPEKDANNNVINLKQKIFILKGLDIFCFF